ncbi:MAG TPA: ABC transporter permease subunit [Gemmataceae bacterium]|jgi:phosphate transport system permease protein|nr:ABC transporter permease subunit [Gemmataceae bacterium]
MEAKRSYTGYNRRRKTSRLVRFGEIMSRTLITVGGIGTIVAVAMVCVFLVWVAYPLFLGAAVKPDGTFAAPPGATAPLRTGMDEYQLLGWSLYPNGKLRVYRLDDGRVLEERSLFPGLKLTACSTPSHEEDMAFGFAGGTVQLGRIGFTTGFPEAKEVPASLQKLGMGEVVDFEGGILSRTPEGQLRSQKIKVKLEDPIKPAKASAVLLIDTSIRPTGAVVSVLTADGTLRISAVTERENFELGEKVKELSGGELTLAAHKTGALPKYLFLSGVGDNVFAVWEDGELVRVSAQDIDNPKVVETVDLLGDANLRLTAAQLLNGKTTLLVGDSSGRVRAWFRVKPANAGTADGAILAAAHTLPGSGAAVTALGVSGRTRLMAAGYADGRARLYYVTSEKFLTEVHTQEGQPVRDLAIAPKDDGVMAQGATGVWRWSVNPGYPEVTLRSLFRPVWYEGYEKPAQVWQSSSGSDEFEPKFGLWPLVFGTLKATFYSLLMGVPLALLAAVYTSEFLHARARAVVKPTIELMASLPSVVLGFLSALVLAPFVEEVLPAVVACILTVPGAFLIGAYIWQMLPQRVSLRLAPRRFLFICAVLPVGIAGAALLGPWIERLFFRGDFKGWLAGRSGNSVGGWMLLLLPLVGVATALFMGQVVNPRFRRLTARWSRFHSALADFVKFAVAFLAAAVIALLLGVLLNSLGLDPRGSLVGTYVQRNALVVGFIMGFAIIPIIYTIAEDALSAVPEHLRSASLGCGATPWQTASRIIVPTAMSGLFSAVMIGLGRAVGETMIVLMAAGNTPVMDMNIFNGFRTLSANIAVELPEAVRNSTHYRVLFLAALTLFAMTFVLNTVAEMIRLRFRKRAYQL